MRSGSALSREWRAGWPGCHGTALCSTLSRPHTHPPHSGYGSQSRATQRNHTSASQRKVKGSRGIATAHVAAQAPPLHPPHPSHQSGPGRPLRMGRGHVSRTSGARPAPRVSARLSGSWSHGEGGGEGASLARGPCLWSGPKRPAARDRSPVDGAAGTGSRAQIKGHLHSSWPSVR